MNFAWWKRLASARCARSAFHAAADQGAGAKPPRAAGFYVLARRSTRSCVLYGVFAFRISRDFGGGFYFGIRQLADSNGLGYIAAWRASRVRDAQMFEHLIILQQSSGIGAFPSRADVRAHHAGKGEGFAGPPVSHRTAPLEHRAAKVSGRPRPDALLFSSGPAPRRSRLHLWRAGEPREVVEILGSGTCS